MKLIKIEGPCHKWNPDFQEGITVGRIRTAHNIKDFLDDKFQEFCGGHTTPIDILGALDAYIDDLIKQ